MFSELDDKLIRCLADGGFHSGTALGKALGVSRAAVWQHLQGLERLGLTFDAISGRGYRLTQPLELLDHDLIWQALPIEQRAQLDMLMVLPVVNSTNTYLRQVPANTPHATLCLAECQTGGRGRMGRSWISPYGRNIYLSIAWHYPQGGGALAGFSLAVAVAVVRCLQELAIADVGIKWPNDILSGGRKLAGILIETSGEMHGMTRVIVGVGLNVQMPDSAAMQIDQAWVDLHQLGVHASRNRIAALLIQHLLIAIQQFTEHGFVFFQPEWQLLDVSRGRPVSIRQGEQVFDGIARGIDKHGLLLVEHSVGVRSYASGEVSLRVCD